jgi:cytochrome c-type biogenesis protein CcmH
MRDPSAGNASPTGKHPPELDESHQEAGSPVPRRGIRTAILSVAALVGLATLAGGVLWNSLGPLEGSGPGGRPATEGSARGNPIPPIRIEGPGIAGTISVASELRGRVSDEDTLFIIARKGTGGSGAPFAVRRIAAPRFPLEYRLGPDDVMMAGMAFEGEFHLSARLSKSGTAGPAQRGDLEGEYPAQVKVGARGVDIVIARAH